MASNTFSVASVHNIVLLSCCSWFMVTVLAHVVTLNLWPGYNRLKHKHKLAWCNRIASGSHAMVLVAGQISNLADPVLNADPLFGITDSHFFWGSIMYGYLIYDTIFTLIFFSAVGSLAFVLHHCLGLTCCCFGLYFNKMALFGTAIQVFFEGTTPLLHLLGCLKLMGREGTPSYTALGLTFVAQFFVCRVVIANYYWSRMILAVAALETKPAWARAGIAVYGVLTALNLFWFYKLMQLALQAKATKQPAKAPAEVQPSPKQAAVIGINAVSAQDALSDVNKHMVDHAYKRRGRSSAVQHSQQKVAAWVEVGKDQAGILQGFRPAIAGLEPRLSDSSDAAFSLKIGSARSVMDRVAACGAEVLTQWEERCSVSSPAFEAAEVTGSSIPGLPGAKRGMHQPRRPPSSPFEALAAQ